MKKIIPLLLLSPLFFIATGAQAQECNNEAGYCVDEANFYAKILGGANFLQTFTSGEVRSEYQSGYIIAGSVGYNWLHGLQFEAEYAYRRNAIRKIHFSGRDFSMQGQLRSSSCMANLLWDLPSCEFACWNLQPFIGAGIGCDFQHIHASNSRFIYNENRNRFSWQMMAGLAYPILCNTEMTLEYKFHQGGCHFFDHSLGIGLVYKFGLR